MLLFLFRLRVVVGMVCALFGTGLFPALAVEANAPGSHAAAAAARPIRILGLPMQFEKNAGQTDGQVDFVARGPGYALFLTSTQAVFSLSSMKAAPGKEQRSRHRAGQAHPGAREQIDLHMNLQGSNPHPVAEGLDQSPGVMNYFLGNKPENWHVNVPAFAKVKYHEVYRGIDLVYYGNQRQLEYDFVVGPEADPSQISLSFAGAERLEVDGAGDLIIHLPGGAVRWHKPVAYQSITDTRQEVAARFVLKQPNQIGFEVAAYDLARPLIIDPVLIYCTYLGGSDYDFSCRIAVDSSGNVFVCGSTFSLNFPTANAYRSTSGGSNDAFVTKMNATATALVYSTYLGGSGNELAQGLAIDTNGNAYVTGVTDSPNFPTKNAYASGNSGFNDAFIAKLSPTGSSLLYASYLGGGSDDSGNAIAVDNSGIAYIAGDTFSANTGKSKFPVVSAYQGRNGGGRDAFVAKFNTTLTGSSSLLYSTFLGGADDEKAWGIAIDSGGNAYVVGNVDASFITLYPNPPASDFPVVNAFQPSFNRGSIDPDAGTTDGFLSKLDPTGSSLLFSTFLGGGDEDSALGVALDSTGKIYVVGESSSLDFPSLNGVQPVISGADTDFPAPDAFVTVLQPSGTSLYYSTFLGGSGYESGFNQYPFGIAVDKFGDIYIAGETESVDDFPLTVGFIDTSNDGASDAFVAKINPAVNGPAGLVYSTLLGGDGDDRATGIAVDANGNFYVAGFTTSVTNLSTSGVYRPANSGNADVFLAKFSSPPDLSVGMVPSLEPVIVGTNLTYTIQVNNNGRTSFSGVSNFVQFSDHVHLLAVSSSKGSWLTNGNQLIFNIGGMTNNEAVSQSITMATSTPMVMTNSATLTSFESASDPNTDNNVATVISTILGVADVRVSSAAAAPSPVPLTSNLTYSITVANQGPNPATSLELVDYLPPEVNLVTVRNNRGTWYFDSGVVVCDFTNMTNNASTTVTIVATAMTNGVATNLAVLSALEVDFVTNNNTATTLTTIKPLADLALGLAGPSSGYAGNNFTYTLRITNRGPAIATSVTLTDTLPPGFLYVSASNPGGSVSQNSGVVTCTISSLASNATATITITANPLVAGTATNAATVSSSAFDQQPGNNAASVAALINPAADVSVSHTVVPGAVQSTSNATFVVTVTNRGPSTATSVLVSDTIPAGLPIVSIQPPPGGSLSQAGGVITCNFGDLANGASGNLVINVQSYLDGSFTSTAGVSSATTDLVTNNNVANAILTVVANPLAPLLKISRSGGNVILFWSTNLAGFSLRSRPDFSPASSWLGMTDVPTHIGDQYYVTNAISGAGKSYRLVKTMPALSAVRVGSTIVVSWPASAAPAGTLKRTGSLAAPIVWTTVSASKVLNGGSYYVTNQVAGGNVFYQLFY